MKLIFLVSGLVSGGVAFHPAISQQSNHVHHPTRLVLSGSTKDETMDWARAKHCAENFGSCDVDEVQELFTGMFLQAPVSAETLLPRVLVARSTRQLLLGLYGATISI